MSSVVGCGSSAFSGEVVPVGLSAVFVLPEGAVAGFVFFFTSTPLRDFFVSFLADWLEPEGLGLLVATGVGSELTGGGFAAFSRAATALCGT